MFGLRIFLDLNNYFNIEINCICIFRKRNNSTMNLLITDCVLYILILLYVIDYTVKSLLLFNITLAKVYKIKLIKVG